MANKVGRPRNVKSPEELWRYFEAYREWCKCNPRYRTEVTKEGLQKIPLERPMALVRFFAHCQNSGVGSVRGYFELPETFPEFRGICTRIKDEIQADQIEGGMCGFYNPQLTARINGLVDKQEHAVKVEQPLFPDITPSDE